MGQHKKRSKAAKKARAAAEAKSREENFAKAPHSFIFSRGKVGKNLRHLVKDLRKVYEPYTAAKLRVTKGNTLRDLVEASKSLHVTHFLSLTKTDVASYLRLMRTPNGPTLTFKIEEYCLSRDVLSSLRRPDMEQSVFQNPPLLVMNNLSGDSLDKKLMATMFQNMLPSININTVRLKNIRRALLIHYDKESKSLDLRHYMIRLAPTGIGRATKKMLRPHLPDLSCYNSIGEFIEAGGNLSESEGELDGPHNEVVLPQEVRGLGNAKAQQSAIRLKEIGPRLRLQLVKIEEGLAGGAVLHHTLVTKSKEEQESLKAMIEHKRLLKEKRKKQQLENIRKKKEKLEKHKQKSLKGMKKKDKQLQKENGGEKQKTENADGFSSDDDEAYYRKEVGSVPDKDLFPVTNKKRSQQKGKRDGPPKKKRRKM